jgi:hypothetical protein
MAMDIKALAAQVKAAKVSQTGNHITSGRGVFIVDKWVYNPGARGGAIIACEFKVESSAAIPGERDEKGQDILPNAPGTSCSFVKMVGPGKNQDFFLGQVKGLLQAIDGDDAGDVGELLEAACSDAQPLRGVRVGYEARLVEAKESGKMITAVKWRTLTNDAASIESGRAFLGKS